MLPTILKTTCDNQAICDLLGEDNNHHWLSKILIIAERFSALKSANNPKQVPPQNSGQCSVRNMASPGTLGIQLSIGRWISHLTFIHAWLDYKPELVEIQKESQQQYESQTFHSYVNEASS